MLNQLAVVIVAIDAPVVNVKFGALAEVPPVVPQVKVLVLLIAATVNPPEPVYVKPVSVAILNTTVAAVVCVKLMFVLPNAIARVFVTFELNIPQDNTKPPRSSVPLVSVTVLVAVNVVVAAKVVVPDVLLTVKFVSVALVAVLIVPVPTIVGVKLVYVPPLANVKLLRFSAVTAGVHVLPVKSSLLNQPAVVIVGIDAPDVMNKFGALAEVPPVVPKVNVRVTLIAAANPPAPVVVNPVAVAILNTTVAAVV